MNIIHTIKMIVKIIEFIIDVSPLPNLIELSPRKISLVFLVLIPAFIAFTYLFRNQIFSFFQMYWSGALAIMMIGIIQVVLYLIMLAIYAPYGTTEPKDLLSRVPDKIPDDLFKSGILGFYTLSKNQYYINTVIEYWLVRKIILIAIPLFYNLNDLVICRPANKNATWEY